MKFHLHTAEVYVPDNILWKQLFPAQHTYVLPLTRMISRSWPHSRSWSVFSKRINGSTGVVVTDGRGSPRDDLYKDYTDEEMRLVRFKEQRKAAVVGEFAAQVMLDFPSKIVKDASRPEPVEDIMAILRATKPQIVYTHNLGG